MFTRGHALLIGIAAYQHIAPLPPAILNDVADMQALLVNPAYCAYPPNQVHVLTDAQATREGILKSLSDLASQVNTDSTALVYLSCHGGRIASGLLAGEYLLPVNANDQSAQQWLSTTISSEEFTQALGQLNVQKLLVILDCCHAAGISHPKSDGLMQIKGGLSQNLYQRLAEGRGRVILASSRSEEQSWTSGANSLFTRHLLDGLRGGAPNSAGLIRIFGLFEYVQPRVTAERTDQRPVLHAYNLEENFPVALYIGGQKGVSTPEPIGSDGFLYDAYISYVDQEPDSTWVWQNLIPRLTAAGLRVGVSEDVLAPGVARIIGMERAIPQAKRTLLILSDTYLSDAVAHTDRILAQNLGLQERTYRVIPVKMQPIDDQALPLSISALASVNLAHPQRAEREFARLIQALQGPLPIW